MQQLNAIADYWSLRSHGYRLEIEDELKERYYEGGSYMKKAFRIITSLCLCAVFVFSALPFHAMALDNRAYTRTYGGETL